MMHNITLSRRYNFGDNDAASQSKASASLSMGHIKQHRAISISFHAAASLTLMPLIYHYNVAITICTVFIVSRIMEMSLLLIDVIII